MAEEPTYTNTAAAAPTVLHDPELKVVITMSTESTPSRVPYRPNQSDTVFFYKPSWDPLDTTEPNAATHKAMLEKGESTVNSIFERRTWKNRITREDIEAAIQSTARENDFTVEYREPEEYRHSFPYTDRENRLWPNQTRLSAGFYGDWVELGGDSRYTRMPTAVSKLLPERTRGSGSSAR